MYPYIIMKLSKKKIQKLYKSKNQTRKSGGKKSFAPKQNNQRSRKAGALNLRKRTLRKMKGGVVGGGEETDNIPPPVKVPEGEKVEAMPLVEAVPIKTQEGESVKVPEGGIKFTPEDLEKVFEEYTEGKPGDNSTSAQAQLMGLQKEVSFKDLNTYKNFMTDVANLILKKLTQEYDEKMEDMKKKLLKKIEGEKKPATTAEGEADPADQGKAAVTVDTDAALGGPEGKVTDDSNTDVNNNDTADDAQE